MSDHKDSEVVYRNVHTGERGEWLGTEDGVFSLFMLSGPDAGSTLDVPNHLGKHWDRQASS